VKRGKLWRVTAMVCVGMAFLWGAVPSALADADVKAHTQPKELSPIEMAALEAKEAGSEQLLEISSGDANDAAAALLAACLVVALIAWAAHAADDEEDY